MNTSWKNILKHCLARHFCFLIFMFPFPILETVLPLFQFHIGGSRKNLNEIFSFGYLYLDVLPCKLLKIFFWSGKMD